MRIDREAFLLAVGALAGCEHAAATTTVEPVANVAQKPVSNHGWYLGLTMEDRTNVTAACAHRAEVSCAASLRAVMPLPPGAQPEPEPESVVGPDEAKVARLPGDRVAQFCRDEFTPPTCETPLVVAFDGQPIDFAPAGHGRFAFVVGEPATTDWPTAVTPWIALDLDGDGAITSGAELFGSSTVLANGARASNGFAALAELDANHDPASSTRATRCSTDSCCGATAMAITAAHPRRAPAAREHGHVDLARVQPRCPLQPAR